MTKKAENTHDLMVLDINKDLEKIRISDKVIEKMEKEYGQLAIKDADDKEGYELVHQARMDVKNKRVDVEKTRKELTEPYLKMQRDIKAEADRLTMMLLDIENPLEEKEDWYNAERERIKIEKEAEEQRLVQGRVAKLLGNGMTFDGAQYILNDLTIDIVQLKKMSEETFDEFLSEVITAFEVEKQRIENEKKENEKAQAAKDKEMEDLRKKLEKAQKAEKELEELKKAREEVKDIPEKLKEQPMTQDEATENPERGQFALKDIREWHTTHDPKNLMKKYLDQLPAIFNESVRDNLISGWETWIEKGKIFY